MSYTSSIDIKIEGVTNNANYTFFTTGAIIDGWQRIIGVLEIPELDGATPLIKIELNCNNSSSNECYFDDIRFWNSKDWQLVLSN